MKILVDADACPKSIKEILYRAAKRVALPIIFYANQPLYLPPSPHLKFVLVPAGFDIADNVIMQHTDPGDLVITADIPLAAGVIEKQGFALNPRGEFYTTENVRQRLQMRNLAESMREAGHRMTGPSPLNSRDLQDFANALDRFLAKREP